MGQRGLVGQWHQLLRLVRLRQLLLFVQLVRLSQSGLADQLVLLLQFVRRALGGRWRLFVRQGR